jgi:hypothetical protein
MTWAATCTTRARRRGWSWSSRATQELLGTCTRYIFAFSWRPMHVFFGTVTVTSSFW